MSDRELIELAAKAAGYQIKWVSTRLDDNFTARIPNENPYWFNWPAWNPLADDGDAFRLAVKLGIDLRPREFGSEAVCMAEGITIRQLGAPEESARLAIVRAAAEIGKQDDAPRSTA